MTYRLVVEATHLKNIWQVGNLSQIGVKIKKHIENYLDLEGDI